MFEILDRRTSLTGNQLKILAAAIIGDALEFFDYFLIGFVLAFIIGPWKLTFGQSAVVLLSSGIGAIIGAYGWGWIADRIGRRKVFILTVAGAPGPHRGSAPVFGVGAAGRSAVSSAAYAAAGGEDQLVRSVPVSAQ